MDKESNKKKRTETYVNDLFHFYLHFGNLTLVLVARVKSREKKNARQAPSDFSAGREEKKEYTFIVVVDCVHVWFSLGCIRAMRIELGKSHVLSRLCVDDDDGHSQFAR